MIDLLLGLLVGLAAGGAAPPAPPPSSPLSLPQALALAHEANARLPLAGLDTRIAEERRREAEAERSLKLSVEGELVVAPADGYDPVVTDLGGERLQLVAERALYDGGARAAAVKRARAELAATAERYRQAVVDVDLAVRRSYSAVLAAGREVAVREEGLERLHRYVELLETRRRAGQPVAADLLAARVRVATDESALEEARSALDEARARLNVLMGRPPRVPLELAELPAPTPPGEVGLELSEGTPEVVAAGHEAEAAQAELEASQAEGRPLLTARADAGLWGSDTTRLVPAELAASEPGATAADRLRRDLGYSFGLTLSLPLFDAGAIEARIAQARLASERAQRAVAAEEADARLELSQAVSAMEHAYESYRLLTAAVPEARDAYLDAESRYRGGAAGYLEVLDAFSTSVEVAVQKAQAELAYRDAWANALRWGGSP